MNNIFELAKASQNLAIRVIALLGVLLFPLVAAAQDAPTSITVIPTAANCWGTPSFDVKLDGVNVGNVPINVANTTCSCGSVPAPLAPVTNPPTDLSFAGPAGCAAVDVTLQGANTYLSEIAVRIVRPSGTTIQCLLGDCSGGNLCSEGYTQYSPGQTFAGALLDSDGDGLPNCSDPDDDNDGVLDTTDNCVNAANLLFFTES